jgi:ABC-type microcin C transport system permease subunit YejB
VGQLATNVFSGFDAGIFRAEFHCSRDALGHAGSVAEDYIKTARSKGLKERRVLLLHALRNASLPIITVAGWSLARLLGGTIIIEKIFLVPGMGTLLIDAIPTLKLRRDIQ